MPSDVGFVLRGERLSRKEGAHYEKHFTNFNAGFIAQPWRFFYRVFAEQPSGRSITLGDLTFSDHGTKEVKGKDELDLEADNYYFEPTFLRGTPGQKLKVEIENESGTLHNFSIPDQKLDVNIPPKGKVVVAIAFPPSDVVRFFCKFHSTRGMSGEVLTGDAKSQAVSAQSAVFDTRFNW